MNREIVGIRIYYKFMNNQRARVLNKVLVSFSENKIGITVRNKTGEIYLCVVLLDILVGKMLKIFY